MAESVKSPRVLNTLSCEKVLVAFGCFILIGNINKKEDIEGQNIAFPLCFQYKCPTSKACPPRALPQGSPKRAPLSKSIIFATFGEIRQAENERHAAWERFGKPENERHAAWERFSPRLVPQNVSPENVPNHLF